MFTRYKHKLTRRPKRTLVIGVVAVLSIAGLQSSAIAQKSAKPKAKAGSSAATIDGRKVVSKNITITKDDTVLDATYVKGSIAVKADNVTIKNSVVAYQGVHSIRIYPGADGTKILNSTVDCQGARTNGIVFGNYYAEKVHVNNCRNDFMSSASSPATIVNSWIDGVPFELNGTTAPDKGPSTSTKPTPSPSPSPTTPPSVTPTTPPSVTPTTPPSVTPTTPPSVTQGDRPNASNTGVPSGTELTSSGSITVTKDGTVLDGLHIQGTVTISASNVTVRNSLIQSGTSGYPIQVTSGTTGALIQDVEVDNMNGTGIGIYFSGGSGTVRRANIHSAEDGIRISADNVRVEDSYIHDLFRQPDGHHDTIQIRSGDNVTLEGNTLLPYKQSTNDPMNAALQIGSLSGSDTISDLRVVGNYMDGGNFTINGGGRGEVDSATYSGNRFGRDFRYAISGNIQNSVWDNSNVWDDTGKSAR